MAEALYSRTALNIDGNNQNKPSSGILGLGFVTVYWDAGYSGNTLNRPSLISMVEDIENREIKKVYVNNISELSRKLTDLIALFGLFKEYSVELVVLDDNKKSEDFSEE